MSWAIYEIMRALRPLYKKKLSDLEKSEMSESFRISVALVMYLSFCVVCFLIIYIFNSADVSLPVQYQSNHLKCEHKCVNYYNYSCKGLAGLYVIPCILFVTQILTILSSFRVYATLETEKCVLRKIITIVLVLVSLILGLLLKK